jgi:surfactin synthase thioesterase subunit
MKMKLFCIPHAGGSSISYRIWQTYLDDHIEFIPLDLPGHMPRTREPLCDNVEQIIQDLAQTVRNETKEGEPYSIFGHSMGGILLYFLYFYLQEHGHKPPEHLFISGRWPPYHYNGKENYQLDDMEAFRRIFIEKGGFSKEILSNKPLTDYYMGILLADYRLIQSVEPGEPRTIYSNMTILWSDKDPDVGDEDVYKWKLAAGGGISFAKLKGTHFFPTEEPEKTAQVMNTALRRYIQV